MLNPKPVPPLFILACSLSFEKSKNSFPIFSSFIPIPLSITYIKKDINPSSNVDLLPF
jgi:hypothetical protein